MAGLFGFFGKKNQDAVEAQAPQTSNGSKAYFLDADEAKTFGNIEYMRTAKVVKRTFPKTVRNGGEFESVVQVSAMGMTRGELETAMNLAKEIAEAGSVNGSVLKSDEAVSDRRKSDSSLDAFRNMARDIRKK